MMDSITGRRAGLAGIAGAILWVTSLLLEYGLDLVPPGDGSIEYVLVQLLALAGLAGVAIGVLGIFKTRGVTSKFGIRSAKAISIGYGLIIIGGVIALFVEGEENPIFIIFPIGALLIIFGILFTGIAVWRTARWNGWQRYMPIVYAVYLLAAIEIPFILEIYEDGPGLVPELGQAIGLLLIGLAVLTSDKKHRATPVPSEQ